MSEKHDEIQANSKRFSQLVDQNIAQGQAEAIRQLEASIRYRNEHISTSRFVTGNTDLDRLLDGIVKIISWVKSASTTPNTTTSNQNNNVVPVLPHVEPANPIPVATPSTHTANLSVPSNSGVTPLTISKKDHIEQKKKERIVPKLTVTEIECLIALYRLNAFSQRQRRKAKEVARFANKADYTNYKRPLSELHKKKMVKTVGTSIGGTWLTSLGLEIAKQQIKDKIAPPHYPNQA